MNFKLLFIALLLLNSSAFSQTDQFQAGKAIPEYGKIATVNGMEPLPENARFKVSFDLAKPSKVGEVNRSIDSLARFINMHAASGVKAENINLAVVIHGGAVNDVTENAFYTVKNGNVNKIKNSNRNLIQVLLKQGVTFYVCGQSAAYYGVKYKDLLPGVKMSLSAMTAHALLQQQGYTLNPF